MGFILRLCLVGFKPPKGEIGMKKLMTMARQFRDDENGAAMVEYSILVGIIAAAAILVVLVNVWLAGQRNALAQSSGIQASSIVVAAAPLKFGDTLSVDTLREIPWPAGAVPAGAFKTVKDALTGNGTRQALQTISVNEP